MPILSVEAEIYKGEASIKRQWGNRVKRSIDRQFTVVGRFNASYNGLNPYFL